MTSARKTALMLVAVVFTLALGIGMTTATIRLENRATAMRFERLADSVANRIHQRMIQHIALLRATRSHFDASERPVSEVEFQRFVDGLALQRDYRGIQGLGYAKLSPASETAGAAQSRDRTGLIALLEPMNARNSVAIGYDIFSDSTRRRAIMAALATDEPQASAPVELVQEITPEKQAGFLIYIPTREGPSRHHPDGHGGVVYAAFRGGDLHHAALETYPDPPVMLRTIDKRAPDRPLFDNRTARIPAWLARYSVQREFEVAGRSWQVTLTPKPGFLDSDDRRASLMVGALSSLLVLAVIAAMLTLFRALAATERSARQSAQQAQERALLLREMQHRIKNHLARIQAICRQTARASGDLASFEKMFGARLSAMAKAQDAVTRGRRDSADLHGLLCAEIGELVQGGAGNGSLSGPEVRLDGREAQAIGLIVYELATNKMKHGTETGSPTIRWHIEARGRQRWLALDWFESGAKPCPDQAGTGAAGGFGSQLIEALVQGDLEGRFTRRFDAAGMRISIEFPLSLH
ncbi:CHASE domain-containing protein [Paracoccus alkenifer]|uniref:histidine kinase n=1 Tax=Paracoccus alkenifer TaxID=65735 RepID=A0A1H6JS30_9RHOB|nr:CHASE domain-containing protein [Paracoccus alkenifer]SEH65332.1 sensor domain CHASE1-containing protein [Paracoccus alkenifer]